MKIYYEILLLLPILIGGSVILYYCHEKLTTLFARKSNEENVSNVHPRQINSTFALTNSTKSSSLISHFFHKITNNDSRREIETLKSTLLTLLDRNASSRIILRRTKRVKRTAPSSRDVSESRKVVKDTEIGIKAEFPNYQSGGGGQPSDTLTEQKLESLMTKVLSKLSEKNDEEENAENSEESNDEEESNTKTENPYNHSHQLLKPEVMPALDCDDWDEAQRVCFYDRNVGDTLTFQLQFKNMHEGHVSKIRWSQDFHIRSSNYSRSFEITPEDSLWNLVVGSNGREFRVSPITETDVYFNRFRASVIITHKSGLHPAVLSKISFAIRAVPIDLGFVYPGEQLILNVNSFVTLPLESLEFHWYLEKDGEGSTLPSNMKMSLSGSSVVISELRKEQEGIIACAIYRSHNIFLTKQRFLIKEISRDVLIHGVFPQNFDETEKPSKRMAPSSLIVKSRKKREDTDSSNGNAASPTEETENNQAEESSKPLNPFFSQKLPSGSEETTTSSPEGGSGADQTKQEQADITVELGNTARLNSGAEERLARLIGRCVSNNECSGHGLCYSQTSETSGLCRCQSGYYGNGLFCWEMTSYAGRPAVSTRRNKPAIRRRRFQNTSS